MIRRINRTNSMVLEIAKHLPQMKKCKEIIIYPYGEMGKIAGEILKKYFNLNFTSYDANYKENGGGTGCLFA